MRMRSHPGGMVAEHGVARVVDVGDAVDRVQEISVVTDETIVATEKTVGVM